MGCSERITWCGIISTAVVFLFGCSGGSGSSGTSTTSTVPASAPCLTTVTQPAGPAPPPRTPTIGITLQLSQLVAPGAALGFPVFVASPPGDGGRLFVVDKAGRILILDRNTGVVLSTFLNIGSSVSTGGEQGLLGLAFDPSYATNRRFYVNYTDVNGNTVVARYLADPANPNIANGMVDRVILSVTQPASNHNGGMLAFGPDGFLYIGLGDGGGAGDTDNRAQNLFDLLGKMLRIDVSQGGAGQSSYIIPADNPCTGQSSIRAEILGVGLRNPWRYSFDRQSGDLYIADVGQDTLEEIDVSLASAGRGKGLNYGWNTMEGTQCFPIGSSCNPSGLALPVVEYSHTQGCSIIGGYVYRGAAIPSLQGAYFYGDLCTRFVRSFQILNGQVTQHFDWANLQPTGNITSFGEDDAGELYLTTSDGTLYRIIQM
jgi:glucose/arabinose dehydrogenase